MKKRVISLVLSLVILFSLSCVTITASAKQGQITVNGSTFNGTLGEAIDSAGDNGVIEISGTVYTMPIGKRDGRLVTNVSIIGKDNAKIVLDYHFVMKNDDNLDVITIMGQNVTLKNLKIDARLMVDYPLCIYGDNLCIENIEVVHGIRGGINIITHGTVLFKNVRANNNYQAGYSFACCHDASRISFEGCSSKRNWYKSGVLVCGGYGDTLNLDLSGITCYENAFSIHDRVSGTIGGGERATITITAPPKDSHGNPISTDIAMFYPLEKAYDHVRFGVEQKHIKSACASISTNAYGFDTTVYYDDMARAEKFVRDDDVFTNLGSKNIIFVYILRILYSVYPTY